MEKEKWRGGPEVVQKDGETVLDTGWIESVISYDNV